MTSRPGAHWVARVLTVSLTVTAAVSAAVLTAAPARAAGTAFSNTPLASWRANGVGRSALTVGNVLYVGGDFTTVTSPDGATVVPRGGIAAFDLTTGALLAGFRADTNATVYAIAFDGTNLYLGGTFTTVNGIARSRLAAVDPLTGAVRSTWTANASAVVYGLATSATDLFVAGAFSTVKGATRSRLAAVRLSDATLEPWAPTVNNTVNSITATPDGSRIYVGGNYTAINGAAAQYLTSLDAAGNIVRAAWSPLPGPVQSMQLNPDGTRLAVSMTGSANQGAVFDTTTGARQWSQRCDGDGQAVRWIGDSVFTGFHEGCGGDTTIRLTSNNAVTGARDNTFIPAFDKFWGVRALAGNSSYLVAAGDFTVVSGVPAQGFVIFPTAAPPPPDTVPPTAPGSLTATSPGPTAANLSWAPSTDNVGVTGYQVSRDGTLLQTVTGTTFADSGLSASTSYTYSVRAVDAAGNLSDPATASVTTGAAPAQQYITNTSVETDLTGWTGVWAPATTQISRPAGTAHDGNYAIRVDTTSTATTSAGVVDGPRAVPSAVGGTVYTASAWVQASVAGTRICLRQSGYTTATGWTSLGNTQTCVTPADTLWHQVSNSYQATTSGSSVSIAIYAPSVTAGKYFLADDFAETSP